MRSQEAKEKRMQEIEEAAYALLSETGYKATSMLAVAKRSKASNETLYRWYGNKQGLFRRMVERNATAASGTIEKALEARRPIGDLLEDLGPLLLRLVLGERSVALNRAAAGDIHDSASLGAMIAAGGRAKIQDLLAEAFSREKDVPLPPREAASLYLDLLVGDAQLKRVIGAADYPGETWIEDRAAWTKRMFRLLIGQAEGKQRAQEKNGRPKPPAPAS